MQDTYYKTGLCQFIARSQSFEHATMAVIAASRQMIHTSTMRVWRKRNIVQESEANSVWLGVDVTWNDQLLLINSEPVFIVMENLFCTYFFLEVGWTLFKSGGKYK